MATSSGTPAATQAVGSEAFVQSIGLNTHIDFQAYGYQNFAATEAAITYLGITSLRDSPENPADIGANGWWQQVATATGARFDAYMPEGSVGQMQSALPLAEDLGNQGILNAIEGGNEEDDPYATQNGNSPSAAAAFQRQVNAAAHSLGLPAINISFGQGWTAANNWQGDYGSVGNLSAYADDANGHTYPGGAPESSIQLILTDSLLAAPGRPVIQTEFGYDTNTINSATAAKYTLDGLLDSYAAGIANTYLYALYDDGSGAFGLMNTDGTPKPAGLAVHDLIRLLADPNAPAGFTSGSLSYAVSGGDGAERTLLMQKSDGTDWVAVWDESQALGSTQTITLNLASAAKHIEVYDPLTGTSATQSFTNTASAQITLPDHPLLIEVVPPGGGASVGTTTTTGASSSKGASSGPPSPTTNDPPPPTGSSSAPIADNLSIAAPASSALLVVNTSTGQQVAAAPTPFSVPAAGLNDSYVNLTPDNLSVSVGTPGWFIYTGDGNDMITVSSGNNVIDGGGGSNFLQGGSGTDVFYVDDQNTTTPIWSTLANFHSGDSAVVLGVSPRDFTTGWFDGQGSRGYTGLTLHANGPSGAAALTLTGYTTADLQNGRLQVAFGTNPTTGGGYMLVHAA